MVAASIEAETLMIAAVGLPALQAAGFLAATGAAIMLAAVTVAAEIEDRTAGRKAANPLAKNRGTRDAHRFREAGLDNRHRSWQDDSRLAWRSSIGATNEKPRLRKQPGFSSEPPEFILSNLPPRTRLRR